MTTDQRNHLIGLLAIEGMRFLGSGPDVSMKKAKICLNLIQGISADSRYVPSETMLSQVNIKFKS